MRRPVTIPNLGLVEVVTVAKWTCRNGDYVTASQVLVTIESEKASVDIESPATGFLEVAIEAGPGVVSVDAILGYVDEAKAKDLPRSTGYVSN